MINNSKEAESPTTKEANNRNDCKVSKAPSNSSSSSSWLRLKDPRIVRVSRALGGKDRHSKVCTIRGLRDRRVRLSVPTAIQLYDLQDRLGVNQPSKVVDWLLNAAKDEIDELPPLPIPPQNFSLNHQIALNPPQEAAAGAVASNKGLNWSCDAFWRAKSKEVTRDEKRDEEEKQVHHSSMSAMSNNALPFGSYYHFESPNFCLPHLGFASQSNSTGDTSAAHNFNLMCTPPTSGATQPLFPPYASASVEMDPRQQVNHFQLLASSGIQHLLPNPLTSPPAATYSINQSIRPFHLSMSPHSYTSGETRDGKGQQQQFPSK